MRPRQSGGQWTISGENLSPKDTLFDPLPTGGIYVSTLGGLSRKTTYCFRINIVEATRHR